MTNKHAILFDLDGTLIDSFYIYNEAVNHVLSRFGISCTYEEASEHAGMFGEELYTLFLKQHGKYNISDKAKLKKIFDDKFSKLLRNINIPQDSIDTIVKLNDANHKMAICTGAPRVMIDAAIPHHIQQMFGSIITCEDVTNGKPHPETFLKASSELDTPPQRCIVVGDGKYDMIGASRANMTFILLRNEYNTEINSRFIHEINTITELPDMLI